MSNVQLALSLSNPSEGIDDLLFLEQQQPDPYVGKLTKGQMAIATLGWLNPDLGYDVDNNCGGDDGMFSTTVYAYLYKQDLEYTLAVSYGSLGKARVQETTYTEIIKCSLKDSVDFSYPNEEVLSSSWVGNTYDSVGNLVNKPQYTYDNRSVFFTDKVYGSLRIRYKVIRHAYGLTISSRKIDDDTVTENKYQSVAYAIWSSDIDWIEVVTPYGFEETDGFCGNGSITRIDPDPEQPWVPTAQPRDKTIKINYCTQEVQT